MNKSKVAKHLLTGHKCQECRDYEGFSFELWCRDKSHYTWPEKNHGHDMKPKPELGPCEHWKAKSEQA